MRNCSSAYSFAYKYTDPKTHWRNDFFEREEAVEILNGLPRDTGRILEGFLRDSGGILAGLINDLWR